MTKTALDRRMDVSHKIGSIFHRLPIRKSYVLGKLLGKLILPAHRGSTVIKTNYGFRILVNPTSGRFVDENLYFGGAYEPGTLHVMKAALRAGDSFADVGSSIGLMAVYASTLVGPDGLVYAYEPDPVTYEILLDNIRLNNAKNVRPSNLAIGSAAGHRRIYLRARGAASLVPPRNLTSAGVSVQLDTLDRILPPEGPSRIRLIKVDVEGWELEVLDGAKRLLGSENAPMICIECSNLITRENETIFRRILHLNEYGVYKLKYGKESISKLVKVDDERDLPSHDNLFCFLREHLDDLPRSMFN